MNRPVCIHCEKRKPNGTRGLCRACSDTPGVKRMYPMLRTASGGARRGIGLANSGGGLPPAPTDAPVGSAEKMRVMSERVRLGVTLFHPDDTREVQPCPRERCSTTRRPNHTAARA